jgi:hypothetical protein
MKINFSRIPTQTIPNSYAQLFVRHQWQRDATAKPFNWNWVEPPAQGSIPDGVIAIKSATLLPNISRIV